MLAVSTREKGSRVKPPQRRGRLQPTSSHTQRVQLRPQRAPRSAPAGGQGCHSVGEPPGWREVDRIGGRGGSSPAPPPTTTTTRNLDGTDLHTPSPRLESLSWSEAGK